MQKAVQAIEKDATDDTSSAKHSKPFYVLLLLALVGMVNMMDRQFLSIFIVPIQREFGVGDSAMGLLTGFAFSLFYVLAGLPVGRWLDTGNRRNILTGAIALWSIATAACGLAASYLQLLTARIFVAAGESAANPGVVSIAADAFPPNQRARVIGIYYVGNSLGVFAGLMIGGWLAGQVGWRTAFMIVGLPGLLLALLIRLTLEEPPRGFYEAESNDSNPGGETVKTIILHLIKLPTYRNLVISSTFFTLVAYGLLSWSATYFLRVHQMPAAKVGLWLGLASGIGLVAGNLLGGFVADHLASRDLRWYVRLPALASLLAIPAVAIFLLSQSSLVALIAYIPVVMLTGSVTPPLIAAIMAISKPNMRALSYSVYYLTAVVIGMGGGPFVIGVLADWLAQFHGQESIRFAMLFVSLSALTLAAIGLFIAGRTIVADQARLQSRHPPT